MQSAVGVNSQSKRSTVDVGTRSSSNFCATSTAVAHSSSIFPLTATDLSKELAQHWTLLHVAIAIIIPWGAKLYCRNQLVKTLQCLWLCYDNKYTQCHHAYTLHVIPTVSSMMTSLTVSPLVQLYQYRDFCSYSNATLLRHMRDSHQNDLNFVVYCTHCGKSYTHWSSLKKHLCRKHRGELFGKFMLNNRLLLKLMLLLLLLLYIPLQTMKASQRINNCRWLLTLHAGHRAKKMQPGLQNA